MSLSVSQNTGSLREIFAADIAFIRSDPSVGEHVLIKIARAVESFLANGARGARPVPRALVAAKREWRGENFVAKGTLEPVFVHEQMVVQIVASREFLWTKIATVFVNDFLGHPVVLPLVMRDILHHLAAYFTDMGDPHVYLLDMDAQVQFQFEPFPAIIAHEFWIHVAVHADLVILQPYLTFVL